MSTIQSKWFCVIILFVSINIEVDTADGDTVADVIDGINATIQPILTGIKANGIVIVSSSRYNAISNYDAS